VADLFPPQSRALGLPSEVKLTPRAAERVARETAVQKFDPAAKALSIDWGFPVAGRQAQRWAQHLGDVLVYRRDREVKAYQKSQRGKTQRVIAALQSESARLGQVQASDAPEHPRRILAQNVGYFTRHQNHMRYPEYRAKGWPIGSGVTEAAVKQFNKRVKGTEQFWHEETVEPILMLRAAWISQDERWDKYWANRPAYLN